MSSELNAVLLAAGTGTIALGVWHIGVPRWFGYGQALMQVSLDHGPYRLGPLAYRRRKEDLVGLTWVMSNAASLVLVSIGILDIAWAFGDRTVSPVVGMAWIAGWWALRALGQLAVGRRPLDLAILLVFSALALLHLAAATVHWWG